MATLASQAPGNEVRSLVAHALQESGTGSTRRATNVVFEHFTGVDSYAVGDILLHDKPIRSKLGAKHLRNQLAELLNTRQADAGTLLGASESRFSRNDSLDRELLDRAHAILDTYMSVAAALGPEGATKWFGTPNHALDGETPVALLKTTYGRKLVDDLVTAALSGSYT